MQCKFLPVILGVALYLVIVAPAIVHSSSDYMVRMRDGARLATDVYRMPLDPFRRPAIVIRTPYGKTDSIVRAAAAIMSSPSAGYIAVVQDVRGTGESEGTNEIFRTDGWGNAQDGYDTVEWVAAQSWCDGKVGMYGFSALGISAYLAAGARPPSLKCEVVCFAAADMYDQAAYQGGELRAELIDGWVGAQNPAKLPELLDHSIRTSYWDILDAEDREPQIKVPTLHIGGWYDCFLQGNLNHFAGLQSRGDVGARGNQKLIVGPWTHVNFTSRDQGELTYPSNSTSFDPVTKALDWFDYWIKGDDNGIMDDPPVDYYVMGDVDRTTARGNVWRDSETWPPASRERRLHLWGDRTLAAQPARGTVAMSETFIYDPANPVPTRGGANLEINAGPYDQRSVENRSDVLVYTSAQLTEPLEIAGRVRVELHASSSAVDTDWVAKLSDVYPDGRSMLVCDGILQARCRDSTSSPTLMTPRTIYRFPIDLWSTSLCFDTGHRLRLTVSSSNSPRFEANRNNGKRVRSGDPALAANNTVYHDTLRPSALILPMTWPATGEHPLFLSTTNASNWRFYR
jgi:hypothetical protein